LGDVVNVNVERSVHVLGSIRKGRALRELGMNSTTLASTNQALMRAGFIVRKKAGAKRGPYTLTESGRVAYAALMTLLTELKKNGAATSVRGPNRTQRVRVTAQEALK
jgi:predicted transcriptional regulator